MIPELVSSLKDPRLQPARGLDSRTARVAAGRCLVEGAASIRQALAAGAAVDHVFCADGAKDGDLVDALRRRSVSVLRVRPGVLRQVTRAPWLGVASVPTDVAGDLGPIVVGVQRIVDPGNLGTIVRTARALGADALVVMDGETDLFSRRVIDASRGTVLGARIRHFTGTAEALHHLTAAGYQVIATSPRGRALPALARLDPRPAVLVVGNEHDGVSREVLTAADIVVQIPMAPVVDSLNVGVATGISIYELSMRMTLAMLRERIQATLGRRLNIAHRLLRSNLDARLSEVTDLGADQAVALMVIAVDRATPVARLAAELGLSEPDLREKVAPLLAAEYVQQDAETLVMTGRGEELLARVWPLQRRAEDELLAGVSAADRQALGRVLDRIEENAGIVAGRVRFSS